LKYSYDATGNMSSRTNNALTQNFGVDSLNQLATVASTGTLTVAGTTSSAATNVTVNTLTASVYNDATFAKDGFTMTNGNNSFSAVASDSLGRSDTNSVSVNLTPSVSYIYDSNGNMTSDGTKGFDYDDDNELIRVTVTNAWKSEFVYDGGGRRRVTKEFTWQNGSWSITNETRYIYRGSTVIQERDSYNRPLVAYSLSLAGLRARTDQMTGRTAYYHGDRQGNVTMMIDDQQVIVAKYLYDPFGNTLSMSGSLAPVNVYRYSSKPIHASSGLYYFGFRFYDPGLQRWINRDPIHESGGLNMHAFANNSPVNLNDPFGLEVPDINSRPVQPVSTHDHTTYTGSAIPGNMPSGLIIIQVAGYGLGDAVNALEANGMSHADAVAAVNQSRAGGGSTSGGYGPDGTQTSAEAVQSIADKYGLTKDEATGLAQVYQHQFNSTYQEAKYGSFIGNALRNIPLIGGFLGAAADVGYGFAGIAINTGELIGKAWASPATAIGVIAGLAAFPPFGTGVRIANNAIQFVNYPWGSGAITLGNAQLFAGLQPYDVSAYYGPLTNVGLHEQGHTYQYQLLGIFFPAVYLPGGFASPENPLEQAADRYALGGSWWPWSGRH
jgi:RHS repeat-associated protein